MTKTRGTGDSWWAGLRSALATGLLLLVLALAVVLAVVPKLLGGAALTVLTGSMEPTLSPGDVVVVRGVGDAARDVQVGDVVAFQPVSDDPTLITHRIVEKRFSSSGTQFVTRGDANNANDDPIEPGQIKGVAVYHVPWIGHVTLWLGDRKPIVVGALAVALLVYAGFMIFRPSRPGRAEVKAVEASPREAEPRLAVGVLPTSVTAIPSQQPAAAAVPEPAVPAWSQPAPQAIVPVAEPAPPTSRRARREAGL